MMSDCEGAVTLRSKVASMHPDHASLTPARREKLEREIQIGLAGRLAPERFTGVAARPFEWHVDAHFIEARLQQYCSRRAERRAHCSYLLERARSELYFPPSWFAVHIVAGRLAKDGELNAVSVPLDQITAGMVTLYQRRLVKEALANASINDYINVLKSLIGKAVEWEIIGESPFRRPVRALKVATPTNRIGASS